MGNGFSTGPSSKGLEYGKKTDKHRRTLTCETVNHTKEIHYVLCDLKRAVR